MRYNILELDKIKDEEKIQRILVKLSQQIEDAIFFSVDRSPFTKQQIATRWGIHPSLISHIINPYRKVSLHAPKIPFLIYATLRTDLLHTLAEMIDAFLVQNPKAIISGNTFLDFSDTLKNFSKLTEKVGEAFSDGIITAEEAKQIRAAWEAIKSKGEGFVVEVENIAKRR